MSRSRPHARRRSGERVERIASQCRLSLESDTESVSCSASRRAVREPPTRMRRRRTASDLRASHERPRSGRSGSYRRPPSRARHRRPPRTGGLPSRQRSGFLRHLASLPFRPSADTGTVGATGSNVVKNFIFSIRRHRLSTRCPGRKRRGFAVSDRLFHNDARGDG